MLLLSIILVSFLHWPIYCQDENIKITSIDVACSKTHMTVHMSFSSEFNGMVYSRGNFGNRKCVYISPRSHVIDTSFDIYYDKCGTVPDIHGQYFENTIIVQYGTDILGSNDETKRLRCEWHDVYQASITQPVVHVSDPEPVVMNFQGDNIDCWMEILEGNSPWSRKIDGIVAIGTPMTLVVGMLDKSNQFDMRVKTCYTHDGHKKPVYLTDEYGCVQRTSLMSPFKKIRDTTGRADVMCYSHFNAFKFPDSIDVYIQCTVEICRYGCEDTCGEDNDFRDDTFDKDKGVNNAKLTSLFDKKLSDINNKRLKGLKEKHLRDLINKTLNELRDKRLHDRRPKDIHAFVLKNLHSQKLRDIRNLILNELSHNNDNSANDDVRGDINLNQHHSPSIRSWPDDDTNFKDDGTDIQPLSFSVLRRKDMKNTLPPDILQSRARKGNQSVVEINLYSSIAVPVKGSAGDDNNGDIIKGTQMWSILAEKANASNQSSPVQLNRKPIMRERNNKRKTEEAIEEGNDWYLSSDSHLQTDMLPIPPDFLRWLGKSRQRSLFNHIHPRIKLSLVSKTGKILTRKYLYPISPVQLSTKSKRYQKYNKHSRMRRSTGELGITRKFKVISIQDLAFDPSTTESSTIYDGRKDMVTHSLCSPKLDVVGPLSFLCLITVCSCLAAGFFLYQYFNTSSEESSKLITKCENSDQTTEYELIHVDNVTNTSKEDKLNI